MTFMELITRRESCRRFSDRPIPREWIENCLEAARMAPSACNAQPWYFLVLDRDPEKRRILEPACSGIYKQTAFILDAPIVIAVKTERAIFLTKMGGMIRNVQYSLIDIGIACEHLVLQASALGLDSCWIGWFNEKAVKKGLGLGKSEHIDILIALGHRQPGLDNRPKIRRSLEEIRSYPLDPR